jgi:acetyl-CoA acetyltransferase
MIASPFRLYDCCLETDGACALIVSSHSQAHDLRRRPVEILAAVQSTEPNWGSGQTTHNVPEPAYLTGNQGTLAAKLYQTAGLGPKDVDLAQFYDAFTGMVLLALEDFGFCGRGEAAGWVMRGSLQYDGGVLPCNTSGGSLSEAYVHGLNLVLEAVRQLRGESSRQVANAKIALVTSAPLISPTSAALLGT